MKWRTEQFNAEPATEAYNVAYSEEQFSRRVRRGIGECVLGRDVLEIGCGHGGISCFLATSGARRVVGIDLNTANLQWAEKLADRLAKNFGDGARLPVQFLEMDAYHLTLPEESFDVVVSENSFEHFVQPEAVMQQAFRVLRPGGILLVPIFSSIYSKYGLHLKHGLKMPWANLLFSEATIVRAMQRLAQDKPDLRNIYPGLDDSPKRVRDLRKYKDLNDITYRQFRKLALDTGFNIVQFKPLFTPFGHLVGFLPFIRHTIVADIFSTGAKAVLRKP